MKTTHFLRKIKPLLIKRVKVNDDYRIIYEMLKKMKDQSISLIYLTIIIIYLDHFLNNIEKVNLR